VRDGPRAIQGQHSGAADQREIAMAPRDLGKSASAFRGQAEARGSQLVGFERGSERGE
jgi:hypothetical protein